MKMANMYDEHKAIAEDLKIQEAAKFEIGDKVKLNERYRMAPGLKAEGHGNNSVFTVRDIKIVDDNLIEYWFDESEYAAWECELELA